MTYARKSIRLTQRTQGIPAEVEILKKLHHKHVVSLAAHLQTSDQLLLFMTPVVVTNLDAYLRADSTGVVDRLQWALLSKWKGCTRSALEYCHDLDIRHGDIKPSNILISSDQTIYLADFGSAQVKSLEQKAWTPKYCSPETAQHHTSGKAADIFSLGCVWVKMETVATGLSIEAFDTFRLASRSDNSFNTTLAR